MFTKALWLSRVRLMKRIFTRKLTSEQHKRAWLKYENTVLYYRSNGCFLFHIFHFLMFSIFGNSPYEESKVYLNSEDVKFDTANALSVLPYITWIYIAGNFIRVILIIISIKRPQICKVYFHYECVMMLLD